MDSRRGRPARRAGGARPRRGSGGGVGGSPLHGHQLYSPGKLAYARGETPRPKVECILCALAGRDPAVTCMEVGRVDGMVVSLNLYPYNPGHMMVFPERHVVDPRDFSETEVLALHRVTGRVLGTLERMYQPQSFNLGNNLGPSSGASIPHWHQHVVPRYASELGFLDILGGARLMVEVPDETLRRAREAFLATAPGAAGALDEGARQVPGSRRRTKGA